jgi:hypothetical protein
MLSKPEGLSLAAAARFYAGFVPDSGMAHDDDERLTLAFLLEGTFEAVAVELREEHEQLRAAHERPLGPLGALSHAVAVRRTLTKIFEFRVQAVAAPFAAP